VFSLKGKREARRKGEKFKKLERQKEKGRKAKEKL